MSHYSPVTDDMRKAILTFLAYGNATNKDIVASLNLNPKTVQEATRKLWVLGEIHRKMTYDGFVYFIAGAPDVTRQAKLRCQRMPGLRDAMAEAASDSVGDPLADLDPERRHE
jgi:hypothetical protein